MLCLISPLTRTAFPTVDFPYWNGQQGRRSPAVKDSSSPQVSVLVKLMTLRKQNCLEAVFFARVFLVVLEMPQQILSSCLWDRGGDIQKSQGKQLLLNYKLPFLLRCSTDGSASISCDNLLYLEIRSSITKWKNKTWLSRGFFFSCEIMKQIHMDSKIPF